MATDRIAWSKRMLVEQLRKEWSTRERETPIIEPAPRFTHDGLVMGAGTVVLSVDADRCLPKEKARLLALLSAAYGRPVSPAVTDRIDRAAKAWREGEDCLAHIHLALAGLHRPEDRREAARRLFMADGLMNAGIRPDTIIQAVDSDTGSIEALRRYSESQPRVPAGSGATSGEWTRIASVLADLSAEAAKFLAKRAALAAARALASNPATLTLGLVLIPRPIGSRIAGNVPEMPGLHYAWNTDESRLLLTYVGRSGTREIDATLGDDRLFHDGKRILARLLPDNTLAIDPAQVSSDFADKDGPNLCPTPRPDKRGRPGAGGEKDKDYEDQIKALVNPDNPTPRGYGYVFFNPQTGDPVFIDDCEHHTGTRVEIKSEYNEVLAFRPGEKSITDDWLDQSKRQLEVSEGFPLAWVFAQGDSKDFARKLFDTEKEGRESILTVVIPRMGGTK